MLPLVGLVEIEDYKVVGAGVFFLLGAEPY
jgi:hypothetical protein